MRQTYLLVLGAFGWATLLLMGCQNSKTEANTTLAALDEEAMEKQILRQEDKKNQGGGLKQGEARILSDFYYNSAQRAFQDGDVRKAFELVSLALKQDPNNQKAKDLQKELAKKISETGGGRNLDTQSTFAGVVDVEKVKITQAQLEIKNRITRGQEAMKQLDFEQAIRHFEGGLEIIRWMPYPADVAEDKDKLIHLISLAKERRQQQESERLRIQQDNAWEQDRVEEARRQKYLEDRIRHLFVEANKNFEKERYEQAEKLADEIIALDPVNEDAKKLKDISIGARHAKNDRDLVDRYAEEWKRSIEHVDWAQIPQTDIVQFPNVEEWRRVNERAEQGVVVGEQEQEPTENIDIRNRLKSTKVTLDFSDTPLAQVINFLQDVSGINMIVDPSVYAEGEEELNVDLQVQDLQLENALNLITTLKKLAMNIENGVLIISSKEKARGKKQLKLFDVRDLTGGINDFPGETLSLSASTEEGAGPGVVATAEESSKPTITAEDLENLIKQNIAAPSWEEEGSSMTIRNGTMIVKNREDILAQIEALLKDLRKSTGLLVTIETRFVTIDDDFLEDVGVDFRGLGGGLADAVGAAGTPGDDELPLAPGTLGIPADQISRLNGGPDVGTVAILDDILFGTDATPSGAGTGGSSGLFFNDNSDGDVRGRIENLFSGALGSTSTLFGSGGTSFAFTFLDDFELNAILRAVRKTDRINVVTAPKLTAFNTQRANISILNQVAYIRDFDVEVAQNAFIADPLIGYVQDGVVLDVRPIVSSDKKYITLELRPQVAELEARPIPVFTSTLSGMATVVLEIPSIRLQSIETTVTVPDGGTVLLGGLSRTQETDLKSGIPWLMNIPIVNFFFSRKGKLYTKRNLVVLVTAHITSMEEIEPKLGTQR